MWVALLRGINVGGKNKLPMKDLVELFETLGCRDVRTYIQSGNVIFDGSAALVRKLPQLGTAGIRKAWGYEVPVITRSAAELLAAVERNPFPDVEDPTRLGIGFLSGKPTAARIARLEPDRSPADRFAVLGREIYLDTPNGVARSKLTNRYFDTKLDMVSTMRNWKTVQRLIELTAAV